MAWSEDIKQTFYNIRKATYVSGVEKRLEKEHQKGKLTARERMELLFDQKEFTEINMLAKSRTEPDGIEKKHYSGDGVIAGFGRINGRTVYAVAQDCTVSGGSGGEMHVQKICRTLEMAIATRSPFICLSDSGGARIEEGIVSLSAYSRLFYLNTMASGYIPQIAAIMGNCAGGSSYSPAMCDYIFMVKNTSQFFITGPRVIKALIGEDISMEELGGAEIHSRTSGVAHFVYENDEECIGGIKELLQFIGEKKIHIKYQAESKQTGKGGVHIEERIPQNTRCAYDVREVIAGLSDQNSFFEVSELFAQNMVVGFARFAGRSVGIIANQPMVLGGSIDCDGADKCARFVRTCDCFDIPLLVLVDVPGFYPGAAEEKKGILRHGSKMLYAFSEATVPKVSLIMRKAYGGAYCAMNSKSMGADVVFAWPICEIAVMGAEGAIDVMFHKQILESQAPETFRQEKIHSYEEKYLNPYFAASLGLVDEIILPEETRDKIIQTFDALENKAADGLDKKHGNIPL